MKIIIFLLCISLEVFAIDQSTIDKVQKALDIQTQNKSHVGISVGLIDGNQKVIINSGYKDLKKKNF